MSALKAAMQELGDAAEAAAQAMRKRDQLHAQYIEADKKADALEEAFEELRKTLYGSVVDRVRELKESA